MRNILFLSLFTCFVSYGQNDFKEISLQEFSDVILEIENNIPKSANYSYKADYLFFENTIGSDTSSQFDFSITANQKTKELSMLQFNNEVYQNKEFQIVCDSEQKVIFIQKPQVEFFERKVTDDFKMFLNSRCRASKRKLGKSTIYKIKFAEGARYESCEITVNTSNEIEKYVLFMGIDINTGWKSESTIKPRMEVLFREYKFGSKVNLSELNEAQKFFIDIKTLQPTKAYAFFEIIDLRN